MGTMSSICAIGGRGATEAMDASTDVGPVVLERREGDKSCMVLGNGAGKSGILNGNIKTMHVLRANGLKEVRQ